MQSWISLFNSSFRRRLHCSKSADFRISSKARSLARLLINYSETVVQRLSVAECFLAYAFGLPFLRQASVPNLSTGSGYLPLIFAYMILPADNSLNPNANVPSLGAVVLCGGQSSRLGFNKQELTFAGKTFLETIVSALAPVTQKIVLVGNVDPDRHQLPESVLITQDELNDKGPLEGIRVGLKFLADDCEYAFVSSCDVPLLTGALVEFLFAQLNHCDAIVPTKGERRYGMTAIYRTRLHLAAAERIQQDLLRVCDLADGFDVVHLNAEKLRSVDPELDTLTNINSAAEYFRLLERFGQRCPEELLRKLGK